MYSYSCSPFYEPAAESCGEKGIHPFEEQMLLLAPDNDGVAVTGSAGQICRPEILYFIDGKGPAVIPCDRTGLHIPGGIKIGGNLYVYLFYMLFLYH